MKIRKPPKKNEDKVMVTHIELGRVEDLGPAPASYSTPSRVIRIKSGMIFRVPEADLEEL